MWDLLFECLYSIPKPLSSSIHLMPICRSQRFHFLSFARQMHGFQLIARLYVSPDFLTDACWRERRAVVLVLVPFSLASDRKMMPYQQISFKRWIKIPALRKCPKHYGMKDMHTGWYYLTHKWGERYRKRKNIGSIEFVERQILKPSHQAYVQSWLCVSEKTQMFCQQPTYVQRCYILLQCMVFHHLH